jgi:hypothetical protein
MYWWDRILVHDPTERGQSIFSATLSKLIYWKTVNGNHRCCLGQTQHHSTSREWSNVLFFLLIYQHHQSAGDDDRIITAATHIMYFYGVKLHWGANKLHLRWECSSTSDTQSANGRQLTGPAAKGGSCRIGQHLDRFPGRRSRGSSCKALHCVFLEVDQLATHLPGTVANYSWCEC